MGSKPDTGAHASVKEGAAALFAGREKETEVKAAVAAPPPSDMMIDDLMFSDGVFPSLPDFPCLSSPSESPSMSTSATSSQPKTACFSKKSSASSTSSSSSSSSWSFLKFTAENDGMQIVPVNDDPAVQSTDSVELLRQESVGFDIQGVLDAWESGEPPSESWDPTSFFLGETSGVGGGDETDPHTLSVDEVGFLGAGRECQSEDLAKVFLEWLKDNKDSISPEDLRNIKLKRSTIECAASRLGGGKQGRVQLLKLILAWVQNHHLQRKRRRSRGAAAGNRIIDHDFHAAAPSTTAAAQFSYHSTLNLPLNPEPKPNVECYDATPCNSWMPYASEPFPFSPMIPAYIDEASAPPAYQYYPDQPFSPLPPDFHSAEQVPVAWHQGLSPASLSVHYSPFGPARASPRLPPSQYHAGFASHFTGAQPLYSPALSVVRPPSATKEARKNRMARHRKLSSLHHNRSHQQHHQQQNSDTAIAIGEGSNSPALSNFHNSRNWSFRSSLPPVSSHQMAPPVDVPTPLPLQLQLPPPPARPTPVGENLHRHASPAEKRRGLKSEKNLRFLLQKVLKQSDVGSLGRIVLPKKEAEIHLPGLEARDGISIEMEDIGTSRVWNMRYRFWPNNKSRMYLLENTGDFVRTNGLQEGDFIVIYSDVKCGKYMIRGVKVRQGAGSRNSIKAKNQEKNSSSANCKGSQDFAKKKLFHGYAKETRLVSSSSSSTVKVDTHNYLASL